MATFFQRLFGVRQIRARRSSRSLLRPAKWRRTILALERLEDRLAPATLTVNSSLDTVSGTAATLDLREAILLVNSGGTATDSSGNSLATAKASQISGTFGVNDTIQFDTGLNGQTITLSGSTLEIDQNVTITGPGANNLTISGNNQSSVFTIDGGAQVNIAGLTIMDGYGDSGASAGIVNNESTVIVSNSVISNNPNAGIYNSGTLTVNNSTISDNLAKEGDGGGIYSTPGGTDSEENVTVNDSTISDNYSAIVSYGATGTLTVSNSTISGNSHDGIIDEAISGGALGDTLNVTNSIISGNSGSGISDVAGDNATISNSTISDNSPIAGYAVNASIEYVGPKGDGKMKVSNSTISGNSNGGIANGSGTMTVSSCKISGNSTTSGGGGIWNASGTLTVNSSTLSYNSASDGGGIYNGGTLKLSNSTIYGNSASGYGGGIQGGAGAVVVNGSTILNNNGSRGGGITTNTYSTLTVNNSTIIDNRTEYVYAGGGIYIDGGAPAVLIDTQVIGNIREISGGNPDFVPDNIEGPYVLGNSGQLVTQGNRI